MSYLKPIFYASSHYQHRGLREQVRNTQPTVYSFNPISSHISILRHVFRQPYKLHITFNDLHSNSFSVVFFPLLQCIRLIISHLLTGTFTLLFLICPNHLSLVSLIFYSRGATPTLFLIIKFLILSSLAQPHIHQIILISAIINLQT